MIVRENAMSVTMMGRREFVLGSEEFPVLNILYQRQLYLSLSFINRIRRV